MIRAGNNKDLWIQLKYLESSQMNVQFLFFFFFLLYLLFVHFLLYLKWCDSYKILLHV